MRMDAINAILPYPKDREFYVRGSLEAVDAVICDDNMYYDPGHGPIKREQDTLGSVKYERDLPSEEKDHSQSYVTGLKIRARRTGEQSVTYITFMPVALYPSDSIDLEIAAQIEKEFGKIECRGSFDKGASSESLQLEAHFQMVSQAHFAWVCHRQCIREQIYYMDDLQERLRKEFGIVGEATVKPRDEGERKLDEWHGNGKSPQTINEKIAAVKAWDAIPREDRPRLVDWLLENFGSDPATEEPLVVESTFHGWRKYLKTDSEPIADE